MPVVKLLRELIDSGDAGKLTANAFRLLVIMAVKYRRRRDDYAWPGLESLKVASGMGRSAVKDGLAELRERGHLEQVRRGGHGKPTIYRVRVSLNHGRDSGPDGGRNTAGKPAKTPPITAGKAHDHGRDSDRSRPENRPLTVSEHPNNSSSTATPAVLASAAGQTRTRSNGQARRSDVLAALAGAGIAEPVRGQLAELAGITADLVMGISARDKARGRGPGAIVQNIRAAVEAQAGQAHAEAGRLEDARKRQAKQAAEEAERERQRAGAKSLLASLTPDEVERYRRAALAKMPEFLTHMVRDADPLASPNLRAAMVAVILAEGAEKVSA